MDKTQALMNAMDAVSGAEASCWVTLEDGKRYNFLQLKKFDSNVELTIAELGILGKSGKGHKPAGWKGTWNATAYYNQSIFREMLLEYKKTGKIRPFEIQVSNEDAASMVGRQTIILKGCCFSGGSLAKFDVDAENLEEDVEGTFDDWEMPEKFTLLNGMQ